MATYPVDLTMPLREGIAAYPSHGRSILGLSRVMKHSDFSGKGRFNPYDGAEVSFEVTQWLLGDQVGTHMDAPSHTDPHSRYAIDVAHLETGPKRSEAEFRPGDILLLRTGASDDALSAHGEYVLRAWGPTKQASEWVRQRGVKTVGIDCVPIESSGTVAQASVHTNLLRPRRPPRSDRALP